MRIMTKSWTLDNRETIGLRHDKNKLTDIIATLKVASMMSDTASERPHEEIHTFLMPGAKDLISLRIFTSVVYMDFSTSSLIHGMFTPSYFKKMMKNLDGVYDGSSSFIPSKKYLVRNTEKYNIDRPFHPKTYWPTDSQESSVSVGGG